MLKKSISLILVILSCLCFGMLTGCGSQSFNYSYEKNSSSSDTTVTDLTANVNLVLPSDGTEISRRNSNGVLTKVKIDKTNVVKAMASSGVAKIEVTFTLTKVEDSKGEGASQTCSFLLKLFREEEINGVKEFVRCETVKSTKDLMMIGDSYTYVYSFNASVSQDAVRNFKIEVFDEIV